MVIKYAIAGGSTSLVESFLLYFVVDFFNWWYMLGSAVVYIVGLLVSFLLRKYWAFEDHSNKHLGHQLLLYSGVFVFSLILNLILMYFIVEYTEIHYAVAQFLSATLLGFFGYAFNKTVTFKKCKRIRRKIKKKTHKKS